MSVASYMSSVGAMIGAAYGEAYLTKQPPRVDDLVAAYSGREV